MRTITILGGDADGNLGDRGIQEAMCRSLAALDPALRLVIVSRRPERAWQRCAAEAVPPGPRGFVALCRAIRRSQLVLVGGGGLFQDDDSLVKMPYWALRVLLVRCLGRPVVGYALGVGPLRSGIGRLAARVAFAAMRRVTVRDQVALAVAQPLSSRPVELVPDPAIGLEAAPVAVARDVLAAAGVPLDGRPLLGVALRRWFPPKPRLVPHRIKHALGLAGPRDGPGSERLLDLIAATLDRLAGLAPVHVVFLPTYNVAHEADALLCHEVLRRMKTAAGSVVAIDDSATYKASCGMLSCLLGGRMHPMIFAAAMGTPVIGLAYNPKFRGFLDLLGGADGCIDVRDLVAGGDVDRLVGLLHRALAAGRRPTEVTRQLAGRVRGFDAALLAGLAR